MPSYMQIVKIYIYDTAVNVFREYDGRLEKFSVSEIILSYQPQASPPELNSRILLCLGQNTGVQCFSAEITRIIPNDGYISLVCLNPKLTETMQRRKFVRADLNRFVTVTVDLKPDQAEEMFGEPLFCDGEILNISAGGMLLKSGQPLPTRTLLGFSFDLPEIGMVDVLGEVVRIQDKADYYEMGIKFINLDSALEDQIVNYVFRAEIKDKKQLQVMKVSIMQLRAEVDIPTEFKLIRLGELDLGQIFDKTGQGSIGMIEGQFMSVISPLKLPINAQLSFNFELPRTGMLEVHGTIMGITALPEGNNVLSIQIDQAFDMDEHVSKYLLSTYFFAE